MRVAETHCFHIGQLEDAEKLLVMWVYAWTQFNGLPDLFDMAASERHPLQKVHLTGYFSSLALWVDTNA